MKKSTKLLSLVLAGITLASAMTVSASASKIFIGNTGCGTSCSCEDCKEEKNIIIPIGTPVKKPSKIFKTVTVLEPASYKGDENSPATVYVGKEVVVKKPCITPVVKPSYPSYKYDYCFGKLYGYKYFDRVNAKEWIKEYFEDNTYTLDFYKGEVRSFNSEIYYFSEDPSVAYFDYDDGRIVANSKGTTYMYAYTNGGVPLCRLKINVARSYINKQPANLIVEADKWNVEIGGQIQFKTTASDGKTYDDIIYTIKSGADKASLTQITGQFKAEKNGLVIVRAYSKSNPNVYGEMLVYIGSYINAILDGCFTKYDDCISVNGWFDGCFTSGNYYTIMGWVKGEDGILIPVIAKKTAMIPTVKGEYISYIELFRRMYGYKNNICDILEKYNELKYGKFCDKIVCDEYDYRDFFFANTLEDLIGKYN